MVNDLFVFKNFGVEFPLTAKKQNKPSKKPVFNQSNQSMGNDVRELEDHFLQDYIAIFQLQFEKLLKKNLELVNENINLRSKNNEYLSLGEIKKMEHLMGSERLTKERDLLLVQVKDYSQRIEELSKENDLLNKTKTLLLQESNTKVDVLVTENKELLVDVQKSNQLINRQRIDIAGKEKKIDQLSTSLNELNEQFEAYENDILEKIELVQHEHDKEIKSLKELVSKLSKSNGYDILHKEIEGEFSRAIENKDKQISKLSAINNEIRERVKTDTFAIQKTINDYKLKNKELRDNLIYEKKKAQELEALLNQQSQIEEKLPVNSDGGPIKQKQKEIGNIVELSNDAVWEIKGFDNSGDLLTYLEVQELIKKKQIDKNKFIRKESQWWKKIKDVAEFQLVYFTKEVNGFKKVFLKRDSFRVPTNLNVKIFNEKTEMTGKCLNLSKGGCFVEVKDFSSHKLKKDQEFHIKFIDKTLGSSFEVIGQIRELAENEKGVGFMFEGVHEDFIPIIQALIDEFLEELSNAA